MVYRSALFLFPVAMFIHIIIYTTFRQFQESLTVVGNTDFNSKQFKFKHSYRINN